MNFKYYHENIYFAIMPLAFCMYQYINNQISLTVVILSLSCSLLYPYSEYTFSFFLKLIINKKYIGSTLIKKPGYRELGAMYCVLCYILAIPIGTPSMIYYLTSNKRKLIRYLKIHSIFEENFYQLKNNGSLS